MFGQFDKCLFMLLIETAVNLIKNFEHTHGIAFGVDQGDCNERIGSVSYFGIDSTIDLVSWIGSIPALGLKGPQHIPCDTSIIR